MAIVAFRSDPTATLEPSRDEPSRPRPMSAPVNRGADGDVGPDDDRGPINARETVTGYHTPRRSSHSPMRRELEKLLLARAEQPCAKLSCTAHRSVEDRPCFGLDAR